MGRLRGVEKFHTRVFGLQSRVSVLMAACLCEWQVSKRLQETKARVGPCRIYRLQLLNVAWPMHTSLLTCSALRDSPPHSAGRRSRFLHTQREAGLWAKEYRHTKPRQRPVLCSFLPVVSNCAGGAFHSMSLRLLPLGQNGGQMEDFFSCPTGSPRKSHGTVEPLPSVAAASHSSSQPSAVDQGLQPT